MRAWPVLGCAVLWAGLSPCACAVYSFTTSFFDEPNCQLLVGYDFSNTAGATTAQVQADLQSHIPDYHFQYSFAPKGEPADAGTPMCLDMLDQNQFQIIANVHATDAGGPGCNPTQVTLTVTDPGIFQNSLNIWQFQCRTQDNCPAGCANVLIPFTFSIMEEGGTTPLNTGTCMYYPQIDCITSCPNGYFSSGYAVMSNGFQSAHLSCLPCAAGTWNACMKNGHSTCSW
jgi:hypothetical protein